MAICLGAIGISISDFWEAEWREITAAIYGYFKAKERDTRAAWEQAQLIGYSAAAPHYKHLRPEQIIDLPWRRARAVPLTPEERQRQQDMKKKMDRIQKTKWEKKQQAKRFKT